MYHTRGKEVINVLPVWVVLLQILLAFAVSLASSDTSPYIPQLFQMIHVFTVFNSTFPQILVCIQNRHPARFSHDHLCRYCFCQKSPQCSHFSCNFHNYYNNPLGAEPTLRMFCHVWRPQYVNGTVCVLLQGAELVHSQAQQATDPLEEVRACHQWSMRKEQDRNPSMAFL